MKLSDIPAHAPGIVSRLIDGEAVLVHPGQGMVRVLNPAGARLWELADARRTVADLAAALTAEYQVTPEQAQADVSAFCTDLVRRGVLTLVAQVR